MNGYACVTVDAMHFSNYSSRLCHSCKPNVDVRVRAVDGRYKLMMMTTKPVRCGEELVYDYNCTTDSRAERDAARCFCGTSTCRGSYFYLVGSTVYEAFMNRDLKITDRHAMLLKACVSSDLTDADDESLSLAGLRQGKGILEGLPLWAVKYTSLVLNWCKRERANLPSDILSHAKSLGYQVEHDEERTVEIAAGDRGKYRLTLDDDDDDGDSNHKKSSSLGTYRYSEACIESAGVCDQRINSLCTTLSKLQYTISMGGGGHSVGNAAPPLRILTPDEVVNRLWSEKESLCQTVLACLKYHAKSETCGGLGVVEVQQLTEQCGEWGLRIKDDLRRQREEGGDPCPHGSRVPAVLSKALYWLRDELRKWRPSPQARHDAASDTLHLYACTKTFFTLADDGKRVSFSSAPIPVKACEVCPDIGGGGDDKVLDEVCKKYGKQYMLGQLLYWQKHNVAEPQASLSAGRRGCITLPDVAQSCYSMSSAPTKEYNQAHREGLLQHMESNPGNNWRPDMVWNYKSTGITIYGSPFCDAAYDDSPLDPQVVGWLRDNPPEFNSFS